MNAKVKAGRPKVVLPALSLDSFDKRFANDDACKQYLFDVRWPDGVVHCPRCNNAHCYKISRRPWTWQCKACNKKGYSFSILTSTIFKDTKMPLKAWFKVAYLILSSKKGISALQVYRMMARTDGADYRTYWFMCHRIRAAMKNNEWPLAGEIEADETYVGGKDRNRHWAKKSRQQREAGTATGYAKVGVIGAIARKGNVVCRVIGDQDARTLSGFVRKVIADKVELVATDENQEYNHLGRNVPHEAVNHSSGEYVRGRVHTNNIESFWALLKRGVIGTYHQVSAEYLPLYLNEFTFRHNFRHEPDQFRQLISSVHQAR
jgi:transposase-like protein